ncbi:hypothetical protein [Streptomyces griseus]|uniref:hypothetical protein n=1 Tax=Streptomyces griseus TaxID=1911 RepID=UPI0004CABF49|nr:hypothetical protein [Streptomyces griseus]
MGVLNQLESYVVLMAVMSVIRVVVVRVLELAALVVVLRGSQAEQRTGLLYAFAAYVRDRSSSFPLPGPFNRQARR